SITMSVAAAAVAAVTAACTKATPTAPTPPEVYITEVVRQDVPTYLDLVGQTEGSQDVDVRARVEGFLESMDFREGSFVRRGAPVYVSDPRPSEAAWAGATADGAPAQAGLERATADVNRYTPLAAKQAVSQQELDNARSARDAATAQVEAATAAVDKARLDL